MTQRIKLLAPAIAEKIAAGEVIERPSSIVKELVENSLDAGSTEITVYLEDGGKNLIEIIDNGHGMSAEDLELCIERHATSKLSSVEDLEKIVTLGFRGEALPSVAAVSDLSILSRACDQADAFELSMADIAGRFVKKPKAQKVTFGDFLGFDHGTRIQVRGLFSQIPARLKFLKSAGTEVTQVKEWLERLALAYPHVGFRLITSSGNGSGTQKTVLHLRPEEETSRVQALLSDGDNYPVLTAIHGLDPLQNGYAENSFQVRVHWLQGLSSPNSRKLIQIVNSRAVRDKLLQQAILNPFRQALLPGQFPAVALIIQIHPSVIDVNVHPTKSEIRFLDSRKIFSTVDSLVKSLISRKGAPAFVPVEQPRPEPPIIQPQPEDWGERRPAGADGILAPPAFKKPEVPLSSMSWKAQEIPLPWEAPAREREIPNKTEKKKTPVDGARFVGTLFRTYLMYEEQDQDEIILIDQHAAHERIRYEKLRSKTQTLTPQALLIPETVKFDPCEQKKIEERMGALERLGFEAEFFGEDALLFRGVPSDWGTSQLKVRLKNLVERLIDFEPGPGEPGSVASPANSASNAILFDEVLFESLASEACHSAVRAGDPLEPMEIRGLTQDLFDCEHPWNCPHGRPTLVKIPRAKFEEWFHRKIGNSMSDLIRSSYA